MISRGYVPEEAGARICRAFAQPGMAAIWCGYYEGNAKSCRVQQKLSFLPHHVTPDIPVPMLHETRIGHANLLTRARWLERQAVR